MIDFEKLKTIKPYPKMKSQEMSICLWFDDQAEVAANFMDFQFVVSKIIKPSS